MQQIQSRFKNSLALRYLSVVTSFMLLTEIVLGFAQIRRIASTQYRALSRRLDAQATLMSEVAPEAILNHDFLYLETLARQASEDGDVLYTVVVDVTGKPLTRYLNPADDRIQQVVQQQDGPQAMHAVINQLHEEHSVIQIRKPISSFEKPLGEVWLGYSDEQIRREVREMASHTLLSSLLLSLLLVWMTILLFERQVRRPLLHLSDCAKALAGGDFSQLVRSQHNDEISQLEQAFNQMAHQLQKNLQGLSSARDGALAASRAKSEFLASMSHELRTPLNAILGFSQLMARDASLSAGHQENLAIINQSGAHLLTLINDVLEMTKIEAGRVTLEGKAFNLLDLVVSVQNLLAVKAKSKGLSLTVACEAHVPQYILADAGKLRQILINLVGNAIKFTEKGGIEIVVGAIPLVSPSDESSDESTDPLYELVFQVKDTGVGIPLDQQETIFDAFAQTSVGRQCQDGTGLGLAICRKYVKLMGGQLSVDSQLGQGSTFQFSIQACQVEAITVSSQESRVVIGLAEDSPKPRILIVDDGEQNRYLLQQLMLLLGLEIQQAKNGMEAIAIWQDWKPEAILMDLRMPILDGFEATQRIRQLEQKSESENGHALDHSTRHKTLILALTAFAFEEQLEKAIAAGCDDYVRKPLEQNEIFEKMHQYLQLRYLYQDELENDQTASEQDEPYIPVDNLGEKLQVMPASWRHQLNQAAHQLDELRMQELIEQIQLDNPAIAQVLQELISEFRFDVIAAQTG